MSSSTPFYVRVALVLPTEFASARDVLHGIIAATRERNMYGREARHASAGAAASSAASRSASSSSSAAAAAAAATVARTSLRSAGGAAARAKRAWQFRVFRGFYAHSLRYL